MKKCATNERSEHARHASLNRQRGVGNEPVGNARVNRRREARGERRWARSDVRSGREERESETKRKETRRERNARGEKNERREKVVGREEEKDVPRAGTEKNCAQRLRRMRKRERGKWSGEKPLTIRMANLEVTNNRELLHTIELTVYDGLETCKWSPFEINDNIKMILKV